MKAFNRFNRNPGALLVVVPVGDEQPLLFCGAVALSAHLFALLGKIVDDQNPGPQENSHQDVLFLFACE